MTLNVSWCKSLTLLYQSWPLPAAEQRLRQRLRLRLRLQMCCIVILCHLFAWCQCILFSAMCLLAWLTNDEKKQRMALFEIINHMQELCSSNWVRQSKTPWVTTHYTFNHRNAGICKIPKGCQQTHALAPAFKWSGCIIQWCAVQTYLIMNPCFLQRPKHWWTQSKHAATSLLSE